MRTPSCKCPRLDPTRSAEIPLILTGLGLATLIVFVWALVAFRGQPALLSSALLAYVLGLRHAIDPDHIAAIDNVTRKLMREGQRPTTTGLWFALGHSTIVLIGAMAVALTATSLAGGVLARWREIGGLVSTGISAAFLIVIAFCNLQVLAELRGGLRQVRRTGMLADDLDHTLITQGFLSRLFKPLFALVSKPRHLYAIGFLFGLGFDTATEIGLFGLSGAEATHGSSIWVVAIFPVLFAVGMTLVDTVDGILMLGAYGWAYVRPIRKLAYNMIITSLSVVVALVVGGLELLGLLANQFNTPAGVWPWISYANNHFGALGCIIIGLFAVAWLLSWALYRPVHFETAALIVPETPTTSS